MPDDDENEPGGEFPWPSIPGFDLSQFDLAQVMRMLESDGPVNWEIARQVAEGVALEGTHEPALDRADEDEFEELARAAEVLVVAETGLAATFSAPVRVIDRRGWVALHLVALRAVLEALAETLGEAMRDTDERPSDHPSVGGPALPFGIPGPGLLGALAPLLLGMQSGSMIGYLAQHALGRYDIPLPTGDDPSVCFTAPNLAAFAREWSLDGRDLRFYVALHEVVHAALRSVPWLRACLVRLAVEYVSAYEVSVDAVETEFGDIDPSDPEVLQRLTEDPQRVLGAIQSERQQRPRDELQQLTSVMEGYADLVLERVGRRLIPSFAQVDEAMRRHRVEQGDAERFIESLLGLRLDRASYERGEAFCRGVVERAGTDGLNRLFEGEALLPTPAELDAPGLWLARLEYVEP